MFKNKKVSLILPAYNEEENITQALNSFSRLKIIDQIIVVDNNSKDKTAVLAKRKGVTVVKEKKQGYGFALRKGLSTATGDYIALAEPDGTFLATDLLKLLNKLASYDVAIGTRTNLSYIEPNANMKGLLRLGNIILAKLIQVLYRTPALSDCGCTLRVMKKTVVQKILPNLTVGDSHFLSELLVVTLLKGFQVVELPIHYRQRVGVSKITGSLRRSVMVGCKMFFLIISYRIKSWQKF